MKKLIIMFVALASVSFAAHNPNTPKPPVSLGKSFTNAMMPGALPKGQTMAIIPRDVVIGSVTTAYKAK